MIFNQTMSLLSDPIGLGVIWCMEHPLNTFLSSSALNHCSCKVCLLSLWIFSGLGKTLNYSHNTHTIWFSSVRWIRSRTLPTGKNKFFMKKAMSMHPLSTETSAGIYITAFSWENIPTQCPRNGWKTVFSAKGHMEHEWAQAVPALSGLFSCKQRTEPGTCPSCAVGCQAVANKSKWVSQLSCNETIRQTHSQKQRQLGKNCQMSKQQNNVEERGVRKGTNGTRNEFAGSRDYLRGERRDSCLILFLLGLTHD